MGMALLCDGCRADISSASKVSVSVAALDGSSVQLDFCWECARPIRDIEYVKAPMREKRRARQDQVRDREPSMSETAFFNENADVDPDDEMEARVPGRPRS